jgi:hypothetical protein
METIIKDVKIVHRVFRTVQLEGKERKLVTYYLNKSIPGIIIHPNGTVEKKDVKSFTKIADFVVFNIGATIDIKVTITDENERFVEII